MPMLTVLRPEQSVEWMQVLSACIAYDVYHLPEYHALAEQRGEGEAQLWVYAEGGYCIALPVLQRSLASVPGLETADPRWRDVTSVYGYAGPVASHLVLPQAVVGNFQRTLTQALREASVVSVFARLHPLFAQTPLLAGLGECRRGGATVSIDLTLSAGAVRARYRHGHRQEINHLKKRGFVCHHDQEHGSLDQFIALYHETMRRIGASRGYYFDDAYFQGLISSLGDHTHLFVALLDGEVTSGAMIFECDGLAQYHLTGTLDRYVRLSPGKLLVDGICAWGRGRNLRAFHLGGGIGGAEDSLYRFKAGFSPCVHDFSTWRWVLFPEVYERLCAGRSHWIEARGIPADVNGYFPAYRDPAVLGVEDVQQDSSLAPTRMHR